MRPRRRAVDRLDLLQGDMTDAEAEKLLDGAAYAVSGLKAAEEWASAARYFQAESFHGLEHPACLRAIALAKRERAK